MKLREKHLQPSSVYQSLMPALCSREKVKKKTPQSKGKKRKQNSSVKTK